MLGDGLGVKLEGINTQLDKAVKSLTTLKTLSADVAKNVNKVNVGGVGGVGGGGMLGNGSSGNSMMPNGGGSFSGGTGGRGADSMGALGTAGMGVLKGGLGLLMAAGQAVSNGLPDVGRTINQAQQYYGASLMNGRGVTANGMANATFSMLAGGLTSADNGGILAGRAAAAGIAFGSAQYTSTMTGVANAAKYLGTENTQAFDMITGLKTGSMSATLRQNFGISTSNYQTGESLTQGQIYEQLYAKMATPGKVFNAKTIMDSFQKGALGVNLKASGLSADQQQLFVQYAIEKSQGNNLDLENPAAVKKAMEANGKMNPGQAGMDIATSDAKIMKTVTDSYIEGQKKAVPYVIAANDALAKLSPTVFEAKAALDTLAGARATGAAMDAAAAAAGSLATLLMGLGGAVTTLMALMGAKSLAGGKGGGVTAVPGKGGDPKGGVPKGGVKLPGGLKSVGLAGAAYTALQIGVDVASGNTDAGTIGGDIGGGVLGTVGAGLGMLIPIPGVNVAASIVLGMLGSSLGTSIGTSIGNSIAKTPQSSGSGPAIPGAGSTTSPAPEGAAKHTAPCSGAIGSRFNDMQGRTVPHNGVDFLVPEGTAVFASAAGKVISAAFDGIGGNTLRIEHADGIVTWYCHLSAFGAPIGTAVTQGQRVATSGNTGKTTGAHLHWGAAQGRGQSWINPEQLLSGSLKGTGTVSGGTENPIASTMSNGVPSAVGTVPGAVSLDAISDMRAKAKAPSVQALSSASSLGGGLSVATKGGNTNGRAPGAGANAATSSTTSSDGPQGQANGQGIYLAGAPRAKNGQGYVANDGPINVHAGEAILTAEQAAVWRSGLMGEGGKGKGSNVVINLTVASASEAEARKFATIVKGYLEEDTMFGKMGRS